MESLRQQFNNIVREVQEIEIKNYTANKFNGAGWVAILIQFNIGELERYEDGYILDSYSTNGALQELEDKVRELVSTFNEGDNVQNGLIKPVRTVVKLN